MTFDSAIISIFETSSVFLLNTGRFKLILKWTRIIPEF